MLSEIETLFDYSEGMRLEKGGDYLGSVEAYRRCWENFQRADFIQDTDLQRETAEEARDDAVRVARGHLSIEESELLLKDLFSF